MERYFSSRRLRSFSILTLRRWRTWRRSVSPRAADAASGSACAPPGGSAMISSMTPSSSRSSAVILSASAARSRWLASFHRMAAQPSGEMTEYTEFSSISTRSASPTASAPPEPPSPITAAMDGVRSVAISTRLRAIAAEQPVPVQLDEVGEHRAQVVEGVRSLRVAGHLDTLHRRQVLVDLGTQLGQPLLERGELLGDVPRRLACDALQLVDLALELEQRTLEVQGVGRHVLNPQSPSPPCGEGGGES